MDKNRKFDGLNISAKLWLTKDLSPIEKFFLIEINSLDSSNECFASNNHFAELFDLSPGRCSQIIKKLASEEYISVHYEYKNGTKEISRRIIDIEEKAFNLLYIPDKKPKGGIYFSEKGYLENDEGNISNINNNNINNNIVENSSNLSTASSSKKEDKSLTKYKLTEAEVSLLKETYEYYNRKVSRNISFASKSNQSLIKRIKEGKTLEMFKTVIDYKYNEWISDPKMARHITPSTLFADIHFDKYYEDASNPIVAKSPQPNIGAEPMDEKVRAQMEKDDENYFFQQNKCSNYHLERHPVKSEKTGEIYEVTFLKQDPDNVYLTPLNGDKVIKMALEELKYKEYKKKVTILYDKKVEDFFDEESLTDYKSRFSELFKLKS